MRTPLAQHFAGLEFTGVRDPSGCPAEPRRDNRDGVSPVVGERGASGVMRVIAEASVVGFDSVPAAPALPFGDAYSVSPAGGVLPDVTSM